MNKEDFALWKTSEGTKELYEELRDEIEKIRDMLEDGATQDEFHRGCLFTIRGILEWVPESLGEDRDD